MDEKNIAHYEEILGDWKFHSLLGRGSSGSVYEITRTDATGFVYHSALKILSLRPEGIRYHPRRDELLSNMLDQVYSEIRIMDALSDSDFIVKYSSCKHCETYYSDGSIMGYDIMIRMELLRSVADLLSNNELDTSSKAVATLGLHIATALEQCHEKNILHRDIKISNVFVDERGTFKLGDFGVSKIVDKFGSTQTFVGTPEYIAPEVRYKEQYGVAADIYSLGIMLYKLQNNTFIPFLSAEQGGFTHIEREKAIKRRLSGEQLPPPPNADPGLANIILKACQFSPEDRYPDATSLRRALQTYIDARSDGTDIKIESDDRKRNDDTIFLNLNDIEDQISEETCFDIDEKITPANKPSGRTNASTKKALWLCVAAACLILLVLGSLSLLDSNNKSASSPEIPYQSGDVDGTDPDVLEGEIINEVIFGNTQANLLNSGLAVRLGGYIFFNTSDGLKRMNFDGTSVRKIYDNQCFYMNAYNGRLFFTDQTRDYHIFSMLPDGSDILKEVDARCFFVIIADDTMVYLDGIALKVYAKDLITGATTEIFEGDCNYVTVTNGYIYLLVCGNENDNSQDTLYCCSFTGEMLDQITGSFECLSVTGDYLYCRNGEDAVRITHMPGSEWVVKDIDLSDSKCYFINYYNDQVYYCNRSAGNNIFRMDIDGSSNERVLSNNCYNLNIVDDWFFYRNRDDNYNIYISRIQDGLVINASDYNGEKSVIFDKIYEPVKVGSSGYIVKLMQERLIELGYLDGEADGYYSEETASAVYAFQERLGIYATGESYSFTINCLLSEYAPYAS